MAIRVAITDDHPVVTKGLVKMFADFPQIQVVATYSNGQSLLDGFAASQPDVLLLDMHLPDIEGPVLAASLLKINAGLRIVVLSSSDVLLQVKKMLQIGCMGYLLKDSDDLTIIKAIETVYYGGQFLSPVLAQGIMDDLFKNKHAEKKTGVAYAPRKGNSQADCPGINQPGNSRKTFYQPSYRRQPQG